MQTSTTYIVQSSNSPVWSHVTECYTLQEAEDWIVNYGSKGSRYRIVEVVKKPLEKIYKP